MTRDLPGTVLFDPTSLKDVRLNPTLARELIKHVPPYDLIQAVRAQPFESNVLDHGAVVAGILDARDPALELVLAAYGRVYGADDLSALIGRGPAYKAAVYGNPRLDWYRLELSAPAALAAALDDLLRTTDTDSSGQPVPGEAARLLASNPRFNREVLAAVIRAEPPYDTVSLRRRVFIAVHALGAPHFRSHPTDSSALKFHLPFAAVPALVRDVLRCEDARERNYGVQNLLWALPRVGLSIQASDWTPSLTDAPAGAVRDRTLKALGAIHGVLAETLPIHPPRWDGGDDATGDGARALLAILLLLGIERDFNLSRSVPDQAQRLLQQLETGHWVVRAASYGTFFRCVRIDEDDNESFKLFRELFPEDDYVKYLGMALTDPWFEWGAKSLLVGSAHHDAVTAMLAHVGEGLMALYGSHEEQAQVRDAVRLPLALLECARVRPKANRPPNWGAPFEVVEPPPPPVPPATRKRWFGRGGGE